MFDVTGSSKKPQLPKSTWDAEEMEIRPEYHTISCELRALAKMVDQEFKDTEMGNGDTCNNTNTNRSPLFERGRFYEEYSARRNERLKRKKGLIGDEKKSVFDLGVRVESAKKTTETKNNFESLRKAAATPVTERRENSGYSLRSSTSKEAKKPPVSVTVSERKKGARRVRKI